MYPALIKALGEEQVNHLMKEFYRIDEERKNWNTSLTILEYGQETINPILIEKIGKSWIELLCECLEDRIGKDGGIRDERHKRGLKAWYKVGEPMIYDYYGKKYPYI